MTYEVGAVVSFHPVTPRQVELTSPPALAGKLVMRIGYAIVVTERDGWSIQTILRTVVEDGRGMLAIVVGDVER